MPSERKEQAIYDAVHDAVMNLRIKIAKSHMANTAGLDTDIAQAGHAAGMAAVAAYRKRLPRKKSR